MKHPVATETKRDQSIPAGILRDLYRHMLTSRLLDEEEMSMTRRGEAFFHVSGAGHEASVALAPHLNPDDWLHAHYRDKALLLGRGIEVDMFFHSLLCSDASHSRGRQMSAHLSDPELKVLSLVGPVGNNALQAAGIAAVVKDEKSRPVVLCSMGDGTTQQGEVLEAIGEAVRSELPVLFLVEDNGLAISTKTQEKTFYWTPDGKSSEFYGIPVQHVDGRDVSACYNLFGDVVDGIRKTRKPSLVVMHVDRLSNHTNADDQSVYRSYTEIEEIRLEGDPLVMAREQMEAAGIASSEIQALEVEVKESVRCAVEKARRVPEPQPSFEACRPLPARLTDIANEYLGDEGAGDEDQLTMLAAMREVFRRQMKRDCGVVLYGEDLEDPKGDVFGLTKGLTQEFPGQVQNSPLAEATIIGASIGRALAGQRPVAFLQFADFLPIAYNQIVSELGSMHWRTDGGWQVPVIVMITCGGYRPGLGPFHAQTMESIAAHTPGVDVVMPSSAGDAAGMLNAAFESGRPTLFFYPKSCLNDRTRTTSPDIERQLVVLGKARVLRGGEDVTLVGWGNAVELCLKAADALELAGVHAEVVDLRSLAPWDKEAVIASAEKTGKLVVVHEDNHTCGFGAEVLATVAELASKPVAMRRVTRADVYIPCNFANQLEVLPSFKRTLESAADLLGIDVARDKPAQVDPEIFVVGAVGSSPSDESVQVVELSIGPGDEVELGQSVATLEADKALVEMECPAAGTVAEVMVAEGDTVKMGAPLFTVKLPEGEIMRKALTKEESGAPVLSWRKKAEEPSTVPSTVLHSEGGARTSRLDVFLGGIGTVTGARNVLNESIEWRFEEYGEGDILRRTGIESRVHADDDQTALSMAVEASRKALEADGISITDIDAIICSTGTPAAITPSMACLVLEELCRGGADHMVQAHDINAACTGYLYSLQAAYDLLQGDPNGRVLVVTTELLSPLLDPKDFSASIIFGDAATATVVCGQELAKEGRLRLLRPELSARGEKGAMISVPTPGGGFVGMDGTRVFSEAVRKMVKILERTCRKNEIAVEDLDWLVPHQANQRIIDAVQSRINVDAAKVFSNIRNLGNTSSNSIPLALNDLLPGCESGQKIGLCAFGGGLTFGAGILEVR